MARPRSRAEIRAIASKGGLVKHGFATGLDPLKRSMEDDRFLLNVRTASDRSLTIPARRKALQKAEDIGLDDRMSLIIAKRSLDLQLRGVPKKEATDFAHRSVRKEAGLVTTSSIRSPV